MQADLETVSLEMAGALFPGLISSLGAAPQAAEEVWAQLAFSGSWVGAVRICGSRDLLRRLAGEFFHRGDVTRASDDDGEDLLGELANIVAGNLNAALPGQTRLGLPAVSEGLAPLEAPLVACVGVSILGETLRVELWGAPVERESGEGRAGDA